MKQKGFAPILIILIVAILGTIGYFAYRNVKIENQQITYNTPLSNLNNVSIKPTTESTVEPTTKATPNSDQTIPKKDYSTGNKLIENMKSADNISETIALSNGNTLNLHRFKEEKVNPYCNDTNDESCKLKPVFGDYSTQSGFDCLGNPFYNPLNSSVNKSGGYYSFDANYDTVPQIYENYYVLKYNNYELFTGDTYEIFLLKDKNNRCHPYKLKFGYLGKGTSPSDRQSLTAVRFNISDQKISNTNYSALRFGCGGSSTRLVENNKTLFNYLNKETDLDNGVVIYSLKPNINYNYDNFSQFNFTGSITSKKLQDGGYALLSLKPADESSLIEQKAFLTELSVNKSVLFVSDPLFPEVLFVYVSFENIYYPGC
jgi:hypothetical protein